MRVDINSVKLIDSAQNSIRNTTLNFLKGKLKSKPDKLELSSDSFNLKDIDAVKSNITQNNNSLYFNIIYNSHTESNFKIDGFLKQKESLLEINFKYEFQKEVIVDNKSVLKKYNFELYLSANYNETISYQEVFEKEDILKFIQKLVKKIFDALKDDDVTVNAVVIDKDDLAEISQLGNKEFSKIIQTLINTVISLDRVKKLSKSQQPIENKVIHEEREKRIVKQISIEKVQKLYVKISEDEISNQ